MPTSSSYRSPSLALSPWTTGVLAACLVVAFPTIATAGTKNWNAASGLWTTPGSWSPVGSPGPADGVFIGNTALATNGTVTMTTPASVLSVDLSDGMVLTNGNTQLLVTEELTISDASGNGRSNPASLRVQDGVDAPDVRVGFLSVEENANLWLDGGSVRVVESMHLLGQVYGSGFLLFDDPLNVVLINDGTLDFFPGFSLIDAAGEARYDLDGGTVDEPSLNLTTTMIEPFTAPNVRISGIGLTDTFDDEISLVTGAELEMDLAEGWMLGPNGTISAFVNGNGDGLARVQGSHVWLAGEIDVQGTDNGGLVFDAPSTLLSNLTGHVDAGCLLWFFGSEVEGGTFTIDLGAKVRFSAPTTVKGGTFIGAGSQPFEGGVFFDGPTTYSGTVNIVGVGSQGNDAMILGPTTINADWFQFTGFGVTKWTISNALTINAGAIGTSNAVYDEIDLTGTLQGKLTMNLDNPEDAWRMTGDLKLGGLGQLLLTRIAGNPLTLEGTTSISQSVQITAPVKFATSAATSFSADTSRLRLTNDVKVTESATFTGGGTLEVASGGSITLEDGADIGATDLKSEGDLAVAEGLGVAHVDRLTMLPTSTWSIDIGGYNPGSEYDQLFANGTANTLAGELDVRLLDLGQGFFEPQLGDVFTVMIAPPESLSGFFANAPLSHIPGTTYLWSVNVFTGEVADVVTLTVADVVSCQADLNGDGLVDPVDLAILLGEWGPNIGSLADFNDDGLVAADDLAVLLGAWGQCVVQ
jgi:hypothetical protein